MKRFYTLGILFMLFVVNLHAACKLSGGLFDVTTGEPLINAYIYVDELQSGTITDVDGKYSFDLENQKKYTIRLSYVGYASTYQIVKTGNKDKQNQDFYLEQENKHLDEVIVSGESARKRLEQPTMGVERLEIGQIRKIPAFMGEVDIIKSIQLLPGVQSTSEGSSSFSVRGGAPDQNLILLDGSTIYNASHLMGFFSVFNNDIINDAVLYKGDIPATHGGRLSSLLEINTKEGNNDKFSGRGGIGLISSRLLLEGPLVKDRLTAWISGRVFYAGMFLPLMKNVNYSLSRTRLTFYDINAKLSATINDKHRLFLSGYMGEDFFALTGTGDFDYANKALSLRWSAIVNEKFYLNTTANCSFYNYLGQGSLSGLNGQWKSSIQDYGLRQEYVWDVDSHNHIKFGFSSSYKYVKTGDASMNQEGIEQDLAISIPPTQSLESALFISNEQKYGQVALSYGLRASIFNNIGPQTELILNDNHEMVDSVHYSSGDFYNTYWNLEPRFGMSWKFYKDMSLKVGYSRTAQYLHLIQTTTAGSPLDVWCTSNKNLKPEICDQVSLGYFCNFLNETYQLSVEGYYKYLQNVVDFKDFANIVLNKNIDAEIISGKGQNFGVEFMLKKDRGNLTGWVSYTFSRSFRTIPGINNGVEYSSATDRPHSINVVLNYNIAGWVDIGASWVYATGQPMSAPDGRMDFPDFGYSTTIPIYSGRNQYRMPDYHRLDLTVTFDLNKGKKKRYNHDLNISLYNVYCRHNAWMINFDTDPETGAQVADMTYLFSIVPSVTYNFYF